jgi:acetoin utilization deacetylase AcuC-like enzyme
VTWVKPEPASELDILQCHTPEHIKAVEWENVYDIAALAAGGAIMAAEIGLTEPCFALIRPPGHHASRDSSWGFCYFNNIAIAIEKLKTEGKIKKAHIIDIDLHFGDGTVNILSTKGYVTLINPSSNVPEMYLDQVKKSIPEDADVIGISAGFDNHKEDWGQVLSTSDYREIGTIVRESCTKSGRGYFAVLEGGYNHKVLGHNVMALIEGMEGK